jgi:hypothetical protein
MWHVLFAAATETRTALLQWTQYLTPIAMLPAGGGV